MKKWVWYVLGAVIGAIAIGGVLYGVLTHKEAGLLQVCWKGGVANYSGDCKELTWKKDQLPLKYYIDFGPDHKVYVDSVIKGADLWNKEIGTQLFMRVHNKADATIHVSWGSYDGGNDCVAGYVQHKGDGGPQSADLVLKNPSDVHAVYVFAAHEWGHVIGLAHDDHAVMKATHPDVTDQMKFVLPSDHDKKLLRELYR